MNTITTEGVLVTPTPVPLEGGQPPELRELLIALQSVREGDFSVQLPGDWTGLYGKVADTFNEIVRSNQRLSEERARAVANYLIGRGVASSRIRWQGFGETQPRVATADNVNEPLNRRVEIKIVPVTQEDVAAARGQ